MNFYKLLTLFSVSFLLLQDCTLDKRIEFAGEDKLGLEAGSKPCEELQHYNRWFGLYGLWRLPGSRDKELTKKEGKVYFAEHGVNWWQGSLNLVTGFFSSIVFYRVTITECDLGTRFVHRDQYEQFFEEEKARAHSEFFSKTERELEDALRKYLDKTSPAEHAGKNYSMIILRTGKTTEARVVGQDVDSLKLETDDANGQKHEFSLLKKEVYKVIFATKIIKVKETPKEPTKETGKEKH
ncbi:LIC_13076 family protein [Leptospira sarikeiensis]